METDGETTYFHGAGAAELLRLERMLFGVDTRLRAVDDEASRLRRRITTLDQERAELVGRREAWVARRDLLLAAREAERSRVDTPPFPVAEAPPPQSPSPVPVTVAVPVQAPVPVTATRPATGEQAADRGDRARIDTPVTAVAGSARTPDTERAGAEASTLTVQTVLLVLGGLLLGVAAITFTTVAWTTFGFIGRAAVLAVTTLVALAVPRVLANRGLVATAETLSAVALLLVGLDGYAGWSAAPLGIDDRLSPLIYAGLVLGFTSLVAVGYRRLTALAVPWFVALIAAQPVLALLAVGVLDGVSADSSRPTTPVDRAALTAALAGTTVIAATTATQNLLTAVRLGPERRADRRRVPAGFATLTWVLFGSALLCAWAAGGVALFLAPSAGPATLAGVALLLPAGVGVSAAAHVGTAWSRHAAAAAAVGAVLLASGVPLPHVAPDGAPLPMAAVIAVGAYGTWLVPSGWRRGAIIGVAAVTGPVIAVAAWLATDTAGRSLLVLRPVWWSLGDVVSYSADWTLPATLLLLTAAAGAVRHADTRHHLIAAGLASIVLTLPVLPGMPWWTAPLTSVAAALAFFAAAMAPGSGTAVRARRVIAVSLLAHAVVAALTRSWLSEIVLTTMVVGGALLAVVGRRIAVAGVGVGAAELAERRLRAADVAAGIALAAFPGAVAAGAMVAGLSGERLVVTAVMAAACVAVTAVVLTASDGAGPGWIRAGAALGVLSLLGIGGSWHLIDVAVIMLAIVAVWPRARGAATSPPGAALPVPERVYPAAAVAAFLGACARVAAVVLPGTGVVAGAALAAVTAAIAGTGIAVRWRSGLRDGALLTAGGLGAAVVPIAVAEGAVPVLVAADRPWDADLSRWSDLTDSVAAFGWQLPPVLVLLATVVVTALPRRYRSVAALGGVVAVTLATPLALGLPWWTPALLSGVASAGLAVAAARLRDGADSLAAAGVAAPLGVYATAAALSRPATSAVVLGAVVGVCLLMAASTGTVPRSPHARRLTASAVGGALAAVPGAVAALAQCLGAGSTLVLSLGLAVASLALCIASVTQLAYHTEIPAAGAASGALIMVAIAVMVPTATTMDYLVAALLLAGVAARARPRHRGSRGAAGATVALVAEVSQSLALLVPGVGLVITALVVAAVAVSVRWLPARWRSGPIGGVAIAGTAVAATGGLAAVVDATYVVWTLAPWGADLDRWLTPPPVGAELLSWQPAVALLILAAAAALLPRRREVDEKPYPAVACAGGFVLVTVGLAILHAPVGLGGAWWLPAALAGAGAAGNALLAGWLRSPRTGALAGGVAAVLGIYTVGASLARPAMTAMALSGIVLTGVALAVIRPAARFVGGVGLAVAVALFPAAVAVAVSAADLGFPPPFATVPFATVPFATVPFATVPFATVAAAAVSLAAVSLAAVSLGGAALGRWGYGTYAAGGVLLAATSVLVVPPLVSPWAWTGPVHAGLAAAIGATAGLLPRGGAARGAGSGVRLPSRGRSGGVWALVGACAPVLVVVIGALPELTTVLTAPYEWLTAPWSGHPTSSVDGLNPDGVGWGGASPVALALITLASGVVVIASGGLRWMLPAVLPGTAAAVLVTPAALDAPWPCGVLAAVLTAVGAAAVAVRSGGSRSAPHRVALIMAVGVGAVAGGAGLAGAAATRATTYPALAVATVTAALVGVFGRGTAFRVAGWLVASITWLVALAVAAGDADAVPVALGCFVGAVTLLGAAAVLEWRRRRRGEIVAVESVSYAAAFCAIGTAVELRDIALVLVGYGAVLGLSAMRRGRRPFAVVAGCAELLAWWLLLFSADIGMIEAYTLPFALLAVVGGVWGLRRRPVPRSWVAYGPALTAAFLPSLALVLTQQAGGPLRRLLLGVGAIIVVVVGGAYRQQAPVIVGAVVVVIVALHELVVWWDLLPRWIPLAIGGLVLVGVGATYERRRRDLRLLRAAVSGMR